MACHRSLLVLLSVLIVLAVTAHSASVHKRSASSYGYDLENDLIDQGKHDRESELKHDLKRLLEILLLDELEKADAFANSLNYDSDEEDDMGQWLPKKRGAPRPGK